MRPQRNDYATDSETGCWIWLKSFKAKGYPAKKVAGKVVRAHRWYYEQAKGPIPPGLTIDHLCRNRACVNPTHLEAVTNAENVRRGASSKLTPDDVQSIRGSEMPNATLAVRYGVAKNTISQIRAGTRWGGGT